MAMISVAQNWVIVSVADDVPPLWVKNILD